jgi:hypothetical protein
MCEFDRAGGRRKYNLLEKRMLRLFLFSCLAIFIALFSLYKGRLVDIYYLILIWWLAFINLGLLVNIIIVLNYYNNKHVVKRLDDLYLSLSKGIIQVPSYYVKIKGIQICIIDKEKDHQKMILKMRNRINWANLEWERIINFWKIIFSLRKEHF